MLNLNFHGRLKATLHWNNNNNNNNNNTKNDHLHDQFELFIQPCFLSYKSHFFFIVFTRDATELIVTTSEWNISGIVAPAVFHNIVCQEYCVEELFTRSELKECQSFKERGIGSVLTFIIISVTISFLFSKYYNTRCRQIHLLSRASALR